MPTTTPYITLADMKTALGVGTTTYADSDITDACTAVSAAIDQAVRGSRASGGSHFYQATETRYYTPDLTQYARPWSPFHEYALDIDDLVSITSVTVDTAGDGSYTTTWVKDTDFYLGPENADTNGFPFEQLILRIRGGRYFPPIQRSIKIVGTFGWPAVPAQVKQYAKIFAAQLTLRSRQAPFGILMQGMEVGATARLMRYDPDFNRLLGDLSQPKVLI